MTRFFVLLFLVDEERKDPNTTISGPSSARQRNATLMVFHWQADGGPTLNAVLVALSFFRGSGPVLLRNLINCDFSGGGVQTPCPSPLDQGMCIQFNILFASNTVVVKTVDSDSATTRNWKMNISLSYENPKAINFKETLKTAVFFERIHLK